RARMPQRAVTADIGTLAELRRFAPCSTRFQFKPSATSPATALSCTFYCPSCYASRIVVTDDARWRDRLFVTARFRCTGKRYTGQPCVGRGVPTIQPHDIGYSAWPARAPAWPARAPYGRGPVSLPPDLFPTPLVLQRLGRGLRRVCSTLTTLQRKDSPPPPNSRRNATPTRNRSSRDERVT